VPDSRAILPDTEALKLLHVHPSGQSITLVARTTSAVARCPLCGTTLSRRIHSRYLRTLADLPWQGVPVSVRLHVRRFFCDERSSCERAIFTERLPGVLARYARRSERLDELLTRVSFALGGEAGARLLGELGVRVSGGTLLEHIRRTKLGRSQAPRILSVDDFAFAATTKVVGTRERIAETTNKRIDPRRFSSVAGWTRLSVTISTIIKVSIGHDSAADRAVPLRAVPLVALSFAVGWAVSFSFRREWDLSGEKRPRIRRASGPAVSRAAATTASGRRRIYRPDPCYNRS
jgi:hypothetical protein